MGRLKKNMKRIKTASYFITLDWFNGKQGNYVDLEARILANKLYFSVKVEEQFSSYSLYDGPNFEEAFEMYKYAMLTWRGLTEAESLARRKDSLIVKANELLLETANIKVRERTHLYFRRPMFLGITDPEVG